MGCFMGLLLLCVFVVVVVGVVFVFVVSGEVLMDCSWEITQ